MSAKSLDIRQSNIVADAPYFSVISPTDCFQPDTRCIKTEQF